MFGHQDDKDKDEKAKQAAANTADELIQSTDDSSANQSDKSEGSTEPVISSGSTSPDNTATGPTPSDNKPWQHPGTPLDGDSSQISDVISPAGGFPRSMSNQLPPPGSVSSSSPDPAPSPSFSADDSAHTDEVAAIDEGPTADVSIVHVLLDIKQHALEELEPLIDQLNQPPEEKFRTIMMMIQASDDRDLVPKAYESAHAIDDEKVRAQALLDIVNEINYFTLQPETEKED